VKLSYGAIVQDARGRFGGTVHSAWRATRLVRRFRKPANPKTTDQLKVRRIFLNSTRAWTVQNTETRNAWQSFALGKNFLGRNAMVAKQVPALNDQADLALFVPTPGDASTLPPVTVVATPGVGALVVVVTPPTVPTGWAITKVVAYCVKDADWSDAAVPDVNQTEAEAAVDPWECTLDTLDTVLYQSFGFVVWLAPDGTTRYSAALTHAGTPT